MSQLAAIAIKLLEQLAVEELPVVAQWLAARIQEKLTPPAVEAPPAEPPAPATK